MITLVFPSPGLQDLQRALRHERFESAAILLCVPIALPGDDNWRLLVREVHVVPDDAYVTRTGVAAHIKPEFGLPIEKKARLNGWSLVYCHTHPFQVGKPNFSVIDDRSEVALRQYADGRSPGVPHCALLVGSEQIAARRLGTGQEIVVSEIGSSIVSSAHSQGVGDVGGEFDRQVRAFGREGQQRIAQSRIGIVGLGGTGSLVAQQLAHLGVEDFILVDHDQIEASNLNRVVGATQNDVGRTEKVIVAERLVKGLRPNARVTNLARDVAEVGVARELASADLVFCCTDSQASRHVLNQFAYQYVVPVVDLGVVIHAPTGQQPNVFGHVKMLAPGLPCLWCIRHLEPNRVREEFMSPEHRAADPYFVGGPGVPQPAIISINSTVASLAVTMFLSALVGFPAPARHLIYDANRGRVNPVQADADPGCNFCSRESTAGMGDAYPLPGRRHA